MSPIPPGRPSSVTATTSATTTRLAPASVAPDRPLVTFERRGDIAGGGRAPRRRPIPRGCDRLASGPSGFLQLRSGPAHGGAQRAGRGPEHQGGFVIRRAFDGGHDQGGSFEWRQIGHGRTDIEPACLDRLVERGRRRDRRESAPERPEPVGGEAPRRREQPGQDRPVPVEPSRGCPRDAGTPPGRDPRRPPSRWSRPARTGRRRTSAPGRRARRRFRSFRRRPSLRSHYRHAGRTAKRTVCPEKSSEDQERRPRTAQALATRWMLPSGSVGRLERSRSRSAARASSPSDIAYPGAGPTPPRNGVQ